VTDEPQSPPPGFASPIAMELWQMTVHVKTSDAIEIASELLRLERKCERLEHEARFERWRCAAIVIFFLVVFVVAELAR